MRKANKETHFTLTPTPSSPPNCELGSYHKGLTSNLIESFNPYDHTKNVCMNKAQTKHTFSAGRVSTQRLKERRSE